MVSEGTRNRKGHPFLVFVLGLIVGGAGAIVLPRYLPSTPWRGEEVEGTVLDKARDGERLLLRVSSDQGLMLATFTQKQEDIDLLVQADDIVVLRVDGFAPFAEDPELVSVRRPETAAEAPEAGTTTRARYLARLETRLEEWEQQIDHLQEEAAAGGEEARARSKELLDQLQEQRQRARRRLGELSEASGDAWDELRQGAERAWSELEKAVEEASEELESEAPASGS